MMRIPAFCAMMLVFLGAARAQDDAAKKELRKMQGDWQVVSAQENDQPVPDVIVQNLKIVIKGNQFALKGVEELVKKFAKITVTVDPATMPKIIDFKIEAGSEKNNVFEGVYELKGDRLTICSATVSGNRPNNFEAKAGSNRVLFVLQREKR